MSLEPKRVCAEASSAGLVYSISRLLSLRVVINEIKKYFSYLAFINKLV